MPTHAANDIQPAFQKNLDVLGRATPTLHGLVTRILAINSDDTRVFVSTDANAHLYAGQDFLLRMVLTKNGELKLQPATDKVIYADANKKRADMFFRSLVKLAMAHTGFPARWADLDRVKDVLTLRGGVTDAFVSAFVAAVREAPRAEVEAEAKAD